MLIGRGGARILSLWVPDIIWLKKKQGYEYHDQSSFTKKNLKSLRVRGPSSIQNTWIENDIAILLENNDSFGKNKLIQVHFSKKVLLRTSRPRQTTLRTLICKPLTVTNTIKKYNQCLLKIANP